MSHSDFTTEIIWPELKRALIAGVDMGWITTQNRLECERFFEQRVEDQLRSSGSSAGVSKDVVNNFLDTELKLRPRLVMAVFSKLRILKVNPTWKAFMEQV